jgi:hypothetical protein
VLQGLRDTAGGSDLQRAEANGRLRQLATFAHLIEAELRKLLAWSVRPCRRHGQARSAETRRIEQLLAETGRERADTLRELLAELSGEVLLTGNVVDFPERLSRTLSTLGSVIGLAATVEWPEGDLATVLGGSLAAEQQREAEASGWDCVEELDAAVRAIEVSVWARSSCRRCRRRSPRQDAGPPDQCRRDRRAGRLRHAR